MGNIGYLLGAGASVDADLPTSCELTRRIYQHINRPLTKDENSTSCDEDAVNLLNFIAGSLIHQASEEGVNPFDAPDIEDIYSSIGIIENRELSGTNPFVIGRWHPSIENFDRFHGAVFSVARRMLRNNLTDNLYLSQSQLNNVQYLKPIVDSLEMQSSHNVFTLNYDNVIEILFQTEDWGIDFGLPDLLNVAGKSSQTLLLTKLHGSIDWAYTKSIEEQSIPDAVDIIERLEEEEIKDFDRERTIVFGKEQKVQVRGPFLQLLSRFAQILNEQIDSLLVIGYSFRDEHINYFLRRWLSLDSNRKMLILDVNEFKSDLFGSTVPLKLKYPRQVDHIVGTTANKLSEAIWML